MSGVCATSDIWSVGCTVIELLTCVPPYYDLQPMPALFESSRGISNEEKIHLRQKLLSHLREENYQISLTLAVLISKIARIDYPKDWAKFFTMMLVLAIAFV